MFRPPPSRIGTRGSPLALAQAHMTVAALCAATQQGAECFPLVVIRTTGDATQERPLAEIGGKGLFTKEIDAAQLEGSVDIAVHSAKDLPTELPPGLVIAGYLPRADRRDALVSPAHGILSSLPEGARVGTVSLRRQALLRHLRADLEVVPLRGNVETRLQRARDGGFHAIVLACAGLIRLGLADHVTEALDEACFPPAIGQGAVALVTRGDDGGARALVERINHAETATELACERAFLGVLDGSCRTPIAGLARIAGGAITFRGMVLRPDGSDLRALEGQAPLADAAALGHDLGARLKAALPLGFMGR